ncbi:epidermal growth factor receptor-like [Agrilus planipennis]|uniref:Receptor protein-tyrosine kinase n=1 Tax=Agrilus planipennis TaxID=224129 RepID=A0A7F5QVE9_AGRPL|nr:epidermal growth factor receptor-like [Agrilus planipennis]
MSLRKTYRYKCHQRIRLRINTRQANSTDKKDKYLRSVCIGTNGRWSVPSNREHHYRNLKNRYTNCTYVDGNLELTWLQDENFDLSFLQYIREVTGYVLISHVDLRRVVLPRLQIIRGRTLFKMTSYTEEFAIIVTTSKMYSLELPALRDVLSGSVGLFSNYNLCHVKTINWDEIISDPKGHYVYRYNFVSPERECPPCHKSCEHGCWGEGEENCQKFSKVTCSPQCYQGRCFGSNPRECCHLFCAGGCTGPKQSDCIACKNFYDDGVCTQECPPMQIYNPITYSWEPNPSGKYAYGATCVKNCPEHLLKDNGACVKSCPLSKKAVNGECIPCNGPCPKTCHGDVPINAANIDDFKDCTVIEGYIHILENSFTGYQHVYSNSTFGERYPPMHPNRLEVFSTLKEITGFLNIQAYHPDFKNLSYFRNLEIIGGRTVHDYFSSLYIVKTSLESLELKSLKKINSGTVVILENKHLCFADGINWRKIIKSSEHMAFLQNNKDLKKCAASGLVCDEQCSNDGCWGPGPDQCLSCAHFSLGSTCLQNCSIMPRIYQASSEVCEYCNEQCESSCSGPGPEHCTTCKHFRDGPYCVSKCPITKYEDNGECKLCHPNCVDGCTGPKNTIGPGACNSCDKAVMNENATVDVCLHKNDPCPTGYFFEWVRPQEQEFLRPLSGKAICRKCHPRCKKCTGYGFHELVCQECTNYKKGEQCEDECLSDYYADDTTQNCLPCHQECRGCKGPGPENCLACYNLKIYPDGNPSLNASFICTPNCSSEYPHKVVPQDNSDAYCSEIVLGALEANLTTTMIITVVAVVACGIIGAIIWFIFHYRSEMKVKENAIKMSMALTGLEDNEPLRPTNAPPNLAKLRIIKEAEMRRGGILGFGAFGTVYKGVWIPEGETTKVPVAIKILRDDTGANSSKEFLEEAYIMATVDHPNLLQLLAVCMTSQMMLVTQLMPLGCLLDFVRNNSNKIGSKLLLNWCTQIARGMAYLEEKRLVHRDLAARNVLVQTPACVKITDFGLAKLLDINEEEYKADGGKMPIKWLALECIQHRIFTHKSDVWAFGVTVWELLTFGGKPYDNVPARNVPELLEKGERLPQPMICTIDVYMIMIKCWMLDAESRPSFKELAEDFTKMTRDPGRFLVIPGDRHLKTFQNQDEKDVRHLGFSLEHSSSQSEGDECLQPSSRAPVSFDSFLNSPQSIRMKLWPSQSVVTSDGSCAPQNQHNWNQERLRYAQQHGLNPRMISLGNESDCSSLKCSSDGKTDIDEYDSGRSQAQVGTLKLELPVDEDDYLMPSPQQTQGASTYVDLIEESVRHSDNSASDSAEFCKTNIDNPEYLMNNDAPSQTIGIPTVSQVVQSNGVSTCNVMLNVQQPQLLRPSSYVPQKSSEEESDHEYYNDFDRLKRELQPLKYKGETTV